MTSALDIAVVLLFPFLIVVSVLTRKPATTARRAGNFSGLIGAITFILLSTIMFLEGTPKIAAILWSALWATEGFLFSFTVLRFSLHNPIASYLRGLFLAPAIGIATLLSVFAMHFIIPSTGHEDPSGPIALVVLGFVLAAFNGLLVIFLVASIKNPVINRRAVYGGFIAYGGFATLEMVGWL